jgi:hypothetical protein
MDEKIKYILKIGIFVLLVFAIINVLGINFKDAYESQKKSLFEGLVIDIQPDTRQDLATGANAFCDLYRGSSSTLNTECKKLTQKNCNETSCCVFTNNKCVAGGPNGPTYNSDSNGNTSRANYYFQNQCYGADCPP